MWKTLLWANNAETVGIPSEFDLCFNIHSSCLRYYALLTAVIIQMLSLTEYPELQLHIHNKQFCVLYQIQSFRDYRIHTNFHLF